MSPSHTSIQKRSRSVARPLAWLLAIMCLAAFNAVSSPLSAQIDEQALLARAQVVAAKMRQCGFTATDMLSDDEFTKNVGGRFRDAAEQYIAFIRRPDTTTAQMNERAAELARNISSEAVHQVREALAAGRPNEAYEIYYAASSLPHEPPFRLMQAYGVEARRLDLQTLEEVQREVQAIGQQIAGLRWTVKGEPFMERPPVTLALTYDGFDAHYRKEIDEEQTRWSSELRQLQAMTGAEHPNVSTPAFPLLITEWHTGGLEAHLIISLVARNSPVPRLSHDLARSAAARSYQPNWLENIKIECGKNYILLIPGTNEGLAFAYISTRLGIFDLNFWIGDGDFELAEMVDVEDFARVRQRMVRDMGRIILTGFSRLGSFAPLPESEQSQVDDVADFTADAERELVLPAPLADMRTPATKSAGEVGGRDAAKKELTAIGSEAGYNVIRVMIPDNASNRQAIKQDKLTIRAMIASKESGGRLFQRKENLAPNIGGNYVTGARELEFRAADLKLGEELLVYYRWIGQPPAKRFTETVGLEVFKLGKSAGKKINFKVGMDLVVARVLRRLLTDTQTQRHEPLAIAVEDAFNDDKNALHKDLARLGLMPVLRVRRCGFNPTVSGQFYNELPPKLLEALSILVPEARQYSLNATDPMRLPSRIEETADLWALPLDGDGGLRPFNEGQLVVPSIRFNTLGDHVFAVDIVGLVTGSEAKTLADEGDIEFPDPHPVTAARTGQCPYPDWFWGWSMKSYEAFEKKPPVVYRDNTLMMAVDQVPVNDRVFKMAIGCFRALPGKPIKLATCVANILSTAPGAFYDWIMDSPRRQLTAAGLATREILDDTVRTKAATTKADEQTIAAIAEHLRALKDVRVALVPRTTGRTLGARSSRDGELTSADPSETFESLMPGVNFDSTASDAREADMAPHQRRRYDSSVFSIIPLRKDEAVTLALSGDGAAGELLVIGGERLQRVPLPAGKWQAELELSPDGGVNAKSGKQLSARSEPLPSSATVDQTQTRKQTGDNKQASRQETEQHCTFGAVHAGTCTIVSVTPDESGDRHHVKFVFTAKTAITDKAAKVAMRQQHELKLRAETLPDYKFVKSYAVAPGKNFACTMQTLSGAKCPRFHFNFPVFEKTARPGKRHNLNAE